MIRNIPVRYFSNSPRKKIELYYDVLSPYSWFAYEVLQRYEPIWDVDFRLKPALLGSIFKHVKNEAPSRPKIEYSRIDLHYGSRYFKVPLIPVKNFGAAIAKGSLFPMRFLVAIDQFCPEFSKFATRELYMQRFNRDSDFTTEEALTEVGKSIGMTHDHLSKTIQSCTTTTIKELLKSQTNEAIANGAFGVPTIVTTVDGHKEVFFGSDRFEIIAATLNESWMGPVPEET